MKSKEQKNYKGAAVFMAFVFILPVITVMFSKTGLDKFKKMKSDIAYINDSIRIDLSALSSFNGDSIKNTSVVNKLIFVVTDQIECGSLDLVLDSISRIRSQFNSEDQFKFVFYYLDRKGYSMDSFNHVYNKIDTNVYAVLNGPIDFKVKDVETCNRVVLLDGRVSRKDKTDNYKKGPLLCDVYDVRKYEDNQRLMEDIALLMPAKQRKTLTFEEDEKLY